MHVNFTIGIGILIIWLVLVWLVLDRCNEVVLDGERGSAMSEAEANSYTNQRGGA